MNHISPVLLVHIAGATIGILSGFLAMFLRKGSGAHGAAGSVFYASMLTMTTAATYIAIYMKPNAGNVLGALLTFYLVNTGWVASRRRQASVNLFDRGALLFALALGVRALSWGMQAAGSPKGKDGMPAGIFFFFGFIAFLCAFLDLRVIRRGGVAGGKRILRHLGRMTGALFITTFSLYPGQAKLFPASWRATNLLYVPHLVLFGVLVFYLFRMRRVKRASGKAPAGLPINGADVAWTAVPARANR